VPKGISLHLGLNRVDAAHYGGWDGKLVACEFDANDMESLAKAADFETRKLLTEDVTSEAVIAALEDAAGKLTKGDAMLVTYSGHGGQVPDGNGDEADEMDETWVLYDRQLVDDELYERWRRFAPGVRIAVFSDSCHSGTAARNVRQLIDALDPGTLSRAAPAATEAAQHRDRALPAEVAKDTYERNKKDYDDIQKELPSAETQEIGASVLLISGCQDNQTSADGAKNGLFTQTMLGVWDNGQFKGSYRSFWKGIVERMPPWQSPNLYRVGAADAGFERQRPFAI
jgi:metacaspase-1